MLQIFTTQLTGRLKNIMTKNEEVFENCARALAQACVGGGNIYVYGLDCLSSIAMLAMTGNDTLPQARPLFQGPQIAPLNQRDRVILFTPSLLEEKATELIQTLQETDALLIIISTEQPSLKINNHIDEHFTLFLQANDPLVPLDDGHKIGVPAQICAAYAYECLYLLTSEILAEYA